MTAPKLTVEFEGEVFTPDPAEPFGIGRDADLNLGQNQFLHRRLLRLEYAHGFWWLANVGSSMSATVSDPNTGTQAWLGPGARLPVANSELTVTFTAGPCVYELVIRNPEPMWQDTAEMPALAGDTTLSALPLTASQKLLILSLAEPMLRREGTAVVLIPSNAEAAERLGWNLTRFNRKLDNVCDKLDRLGVDGMRGGVRSHATNRRSRLIEWAVATGVVTAADLPLLGDPPPDDDDDFLYPDWTPGGKGA
jgi:hypothetical protein